MIRNLDARLRNWCLFAAMAILFGTSCAHEPQAQRTVPLLASSVNAKTSTRKPVRVPDLILLHWPSLGFKTSVSIYRHANGYKLVAERWLDDHCPKRWSRRVKPSQEPRLAELLAILDPHDLPVEDPCRVPVRDGTSWTVMGDMSKKRISRSRQMAGDKRCAPFEAACREIMAFMGLTCKGRGCVLERELREGMKHCP
jgi:hypothetical protein